MSHSHKTEEEMLIAIEFEKALRKIKILTLDGNTYPYFDEKYARQVISSAARRLVFGQPKGGTK